MTKTPKKEKLDVKIHSLTQKRRGTDFPKGFAPGEFVTLSSKRLSHTLDNFVKKTVDNWNFYYCESCFHLRGELVEMTVELESESQVPSGYYECPVCQCAWRLNRGVARHVVAEKIKHYQALAEKLGIDVDSVPAEEIKDSVLGTTKRS